MNDRNPDATEDDLAALALVRANAGDWGVDPARVGMIGFSAGAMVTLSTVLSDSEVAPPAFFGYVYGPQGAVDVPGDAPPMFDAIALDDQFFASTGSPIVSSWQAANVPVELHPYGRGEDGFGLGAESTTTTGMIDQFTARLAMTGFLQDGD